MPRDSWPRGIEICKNVINDIFFNAICGLYIYIYIYALLEFFTRQKVLPNVI